MQGPVCGRRDGLVTQRCGEALKKSSYATRGVLGRQVGRLRLSTLIVPAALSMMEMGQSTNGLITGTVLDPTGAVQWAFVL